MKRQFKKSYKTGITAGILSGIFLAILYLPFLFAVKKFVFNQEILSFISFPTLFFSTLYNAVLLGIIFAALFVALVNRLPTSSLVIKTFVLNTIIFAISFVLQIIALTVGDVPFSFPAWYFVFMAIYSFFIFPLLFLLFYHAIAMKEPHVRDIKTSTFVIVTVLFVIFLLAISIVFLAVDMVGMVQSLPVY